MKSEIKALVLEFGADACGVACIDAFSGVPTGFHPRDLYPECKSVIIFGVALPKGLLETRDDLIYGYYNSLSKDKVDLIAFQSAKAIEERFGCKVMPLPGDGPYMYWDAEKLEGHGLISVKHAAVLAGLGTLGKSTILLNPEYGNRLTLGAMLTDIDLPSDEPAQPVCLPSCRLCIDACPVHAIGDGTVSQKLCRIHTYGKNARGFDTVQCDRCRTVCPMRNGKPE